ncbi:omega-amidase [Enterococcus sp. PF1-24]|uniref:carbon-nitrogen family hydrolase n=1 Tax=unclassified Enterococcus TaxID=2608891 RepID=UPI002473DBE2|nr:MULTISPECIES: carbon-nitrogen family hydrolase [unclassified Enterococcus]MDH6364412.1 omega-amidase [Enterococcus sp. PFB1-1]MDH6401565.1 omega-amidase [Enterococcus sp. PF1-24]
MTQQTFVLMQMDITFGKPKDNFQHLRYLFQQADLQAGEIVVLPEMWNSAYDLSNAAIVADLDGQQTLTLLTELAITYQVAIVGGSILRKSGDKYYNTSYLINEQGELIQQYNKVHLFKLMAEDQYLTAGESLVTAKLSTVSLGLGICYDLRFPEMFRKLAVAGAEVLVIPAQWPQARIQQWRKLLQARGIENQAFVIGVNRVGSDPDNQFNGQSLVINPLGEITAELSQQEEVRKVTIDLAEVTQARQAISVLMDRRPELY